MKRQTIFSLFAMISCVSHNPEAKKPEAFQLAGSWQSECFSPGNGQGAKLNFILTESTWKLDYDAFGETTCTNKNLTVHIEGGYEIGAESKALPGAKEARFDFAQKAVTPYNDGAAAFLAQACGKSGFSTNQATDISAGCAGLGAYPISECRADYDIVLLSGDTLHFGARPQDNNMCSPEKRPTAKGLAVKRI